MSAEKKSRNKSTYYHISTDKNKFDKTSNSFIGKVRSNFMGTEYHVFFNKYLYIGI